MEKFDVAKRIAYFRKIKNMNKNELANSAGISPTYIYQLEKGEKSPTVEYLGYLCEGLGITLKDFFDDVPTAPVKNKVAALTTEQQRLLNDFLNSLE